MNKIFASVIGLLCALPAVADQDTIPFANTIKINPEDTPEVIIAKAAHVIPSRNQMAGLDREFIAFVHFGPNTFTKMEWGTGKEDPALFNPTGLDTDQWVKAMKDAGMKMIILTVKHHDGYVLWQSRYTKHGIMSSPFMNGNGDILKSLSESAHKYGMKLGVYLSPADLYHIENEEGLYGNLSPKTLRTIPRPVEGRPFENKTTFEFVVDDYNEYFLNQLFEILTEYGPIDEVWFDGAHPKRKGGQTYDYAAWKKLIHTVAPNAVVFGREDVRWCGNEAGNTRETEWNIVPYMADPDTMGKFGDLTEQDLGSRQKLMNAKYLHYQYPETDTSIREGWFYRDNKTQRVRSADEVYDIYERSVGGNAVLLLNIPPAQNGEFDSIDVSVLKEVGRRINATYSTDFFAGAKIDSEINPGDKFPTYTVTLPKAVTVNRIVLKEPIDKSGERVEEHTLEAKINGEWQPVAKATNIGHKRILRFPDITASEFRIKIGSSRLQPEISLISGHYYKAGAPQLESNRNAEGIVRINPKSSQFNWHRAPKSISSAMFNPYKVHYTLDGTTPGAGSPVFPDSLLVEGKILKAVAILDDGTAGSVLEEKIGYAKSRFQSTGKGNEAFDNKAGTAWTATEDEPSLVINLGSKLPIGALVYTPVPSAKGAVSKAKIEVSDNGKKFKQIAEWELGNLINDPTPRLFVLPKEVNTKYIRIVPVATADSAPAVIAEIDILPVL
ncbi:MAG: alpha-L-fucosidase [Paramuribaculum sp.]|nr:alpha-L-fucosidase [Paramuribaculum sp.]